MWFEINLNWWQDITYLHFRNSYKLIFSCKTSSHSISNWVIFHIMYQFRDRSANSTVWTLSGAKNDPITKIIVTLLYLDTTCMDIAVAVLALMGMDKTLVIALRVCVYIYYIFWQRYLYASYIDCINTNLLNMIYSV